MNTIQQFREELPAGCPPETAKEIRSRLEVFRLVRTTPPTMADFRSARAENPRRPFHPAQECQAYGLSVNTDRRDSENARKLPFLRGRRICKVTLRLGAGYIQNTSNPSNPSHHTWWPFASYDIIAHCRISPS